MPLPDFQSCMLPLLKFAADGREHHINEAIAALAREFHLSDSELSELLPSGQQAIFSNRVGWAKTYMKKAGLLEQPRRGYFRITERGREVLSKNPTSVDTRFLEQFAEFQSFRTRRREQETDNSPTDEQELNFSQTPLEALENAYQRLRAELVDELLTNLKSCEPAQFERIVVDLLVKMGYGGSLREAGQAVGRSGDGGIDGIIKEDHLGLDYIYIQAKRWDRTVGRPEIQQFAGALQGQRASKGIFITTSDFSREARDYAAAIQTKIILLGGEQLAGLMIDFGVGVTPVKNYPIHRVDSDYFEEA